MKKVLLSVLFVFLFSKANAQLFTFGPMCHVYFTKNKPTWSIGFEAAYYFTFVSIDLGIELSKQNDFFYSELQFAYGKVLRKAPYFVSGGTSIGIYRRCDNKTFDYFTGFQGSIWGCSLAGADIRLKKDKAYKTWGAGTFAKYPVFNFPIGD